MIIETSADSSAGTARGEVGICRVVSGWNPVTQGVDDQVEHPVGLLGTTSGCGCGSLVRGLAGSIGPVIVEWEAKADRFVADASETAITWGSGSLSDLYVGAVE
jgi:hypothetical protein